MTSDVNTAVAAEALKLLQILFDNNVARHMIFEPARPLPACRASA